MRKFGLLLIALTVACGGGEISVRQRFLAQSNVSVHFESWVRSLNNRNQDSLATFYQHGPELRVLGIDGAISRGWEEEREKQRAFFETTQLVNFVTSDLEIEVMAKDMVLTTFRHTLDVARAGGERDPTVRGLGTMLWTQDPNDDSWKIRLLHLSARLTVGQLDR